MMWFFHQSWPWGMQWGVLLALPLCHRSNNLSLRCLLRLMQSCLGSSSGEISLLELSLPPVNYVGVYYSICFLLSGSHVIAFFTIWGSTFQVCTAPSLLSIPWQAYEPVGNGPWPMPGVQWMPASTTREFLPTHSAVLQPFHHYGGAYSCGGMAVIQSLCLLYMVGNVLIFQVVFHPVIQSTSNLWSTSILVIGDWVSGW